MRTLTTRMTMRFAQAMVAPIMASVLGCLPAAASHLVTGNGFGFAVVSPETGTVTKFYAHPYSFTRPDPHDTLSEGIETAQFLKDINWRNAHARNPSAEYENDSQVVYIRRSDGEGLCFMPFGLAHAALIVSWEPASAEAWQGGFRVEWNHPVRSEKVVRNFGAGMHLLEFGGVDGALLLIPLERAAGQATSSSQVLSGSSAWALISLENATEWEQAAADFNMWRAGLSAQALAKRRLSNWRTGASNRSSTFRANRKSICGGRARSCSVLHRAANPIVQDVTAMG